MAAGAVPLRCLAAESRGREKSARGAPEPLGALGDEMRAKRAALGASLARVACDLRLKERLVLAIERGDVAAFPRESVVPGHVRAYARYLGMDPERTYRRFCREAGFNSPAALSPAAELRTAGGMRVAYNSRAATDLTSSRFAMPSGKPFRIGLSLSAIGSLFALLALLLGVLKAADFLLQDLQQVGRATLEDTRVVRLTGPESVRSAHFGGLVTGPMQLPTQIPSRDGPIMALDPSLSGVFAGVDGAASEPAGSIGQSRPAGADGEGGVLAGAAPGCDRPAVETDHRLALAGDPPAIPASGGF